MEKELASLNKEIDEILKAFKQRLESGIETYEIERTYNEYCNKPFVYIKNNHPLPKDITFTHNGLTFNRPEATVNYLLQYEASKRLGEFDEIIIDFLSHQESIQDT